MPGPPPKRSTQRRRRNKPAVEITHAPGSREVPVPRADSSWHPVAKRWYNALTRSGQAQFYEPSDWGVAFVVAESMSRDLKPQVVGVTDKGEVVKAEIPLKGASLGAYLRAMSSLLVTEADRRRAALELERPGEGEGDADVSELADYRRRLGAG